MYIYIYMYLSTGTVPFFLMVLGSAGSWKKMLITFFTARAPSFPSNPHVALSSNGYEKWDGYDNDNDVMVKWCRMMLMIIVIMTMMGKSDGCDNFTNLWDGKMGWVWKM